MLSANRVERIQRHAIDNLSQSALLTVAVEEGSFGDLAVACADATLAAHRFARYDPKARESLIARLESIRGVEFDLGCRFNDMWSGRVGRGAGTAEVPLQPPAPTTLVWDEGTDLDKLTFFVEVFGPPDRLHFKIIADTARLRATEIPRLLYGIERAVLALEDEPDLSVSGFAAVAQGRPLHQEAPA